MDYQIFYKTRNKYIYIERHDSFIKAMDAAKELSIKQDTSVAVLYDLEEIVEYNCGQLDYPTSEYDYLFKSMESFEPSIFDKI